MENVNDIKITRCLGLGPKKSNRNDNPRDIIVRFHFFGDRSEVWKNRTKLKGINIIIKEDFPQVVKDRRSQLLPIAAAARLQGKKASVVADKLIVDGKMFGVSTLHKLPNELDTKKLTTKSTETGTIFYGKLSPLSNFFPCKIKIDDQAFNCVEQYYQYTKAINMNNHLIAKQILACSNPYEHKRLGDRIKAGDDWLQGKARDVLKAGLYQNFTQHTELNRLLKQTKGVIGESNKFDKTWGTGLELKHPEANNPEKWTGKNWMGELLCLIRNEIA